jgi:hypothetical protein
MGVVWLGFDWNLTVYDVQAEAHERRLREKEERAQKEHLRMLQQQQGKRSCF